MADGWCDTMGAAMRRESERRGKKGAPVSDSGRRQKKPAADSRTRDKAKDRRLARVKWKEEGG